MELLINIDVPNLAEGVDFYIRAFGLVVTRRMGSGAAELSGLPVRLNSWKSSDYCDLTPAISAIALMMEADRRA